LTSCGQVEATFGGEFRLTFLTIGPNTEHRIPNTELHIFEIDGIDQATRQTPMFGRGRLDHLGVGAASIDAFSDIRRRRTEIGASDSFVTDFGPALSLSSPTPTASSSPTPTAQPTRHTIGPLRTTRVVVQVVTRVVTRDITESRISTCHPVQRPTQLTARAASNTKCSDLRPRVCQIVGVTDLAGHCCWGL
jgi:hypothetical protein